MKYIFLVVAAAWIVQLLLAAWQLQRFQRQLGSLRKLGRCAVGVDGNRWRGRTYSVLVIDEQERVREAATLGGVTIFATLQPLSELKGMRLEAIRASDTPLANLRRSQWLALQHAAHFFTTQASASQPACTSVSSPG